MRDDVDLNFGRILLERTLDGTRIETTKSSEPRAVDMSEQLSHELKELKRSASAAALKRGGKLPQWVFCTTAGTPLDEHNFRRRVFHLALRKAGLRHTRMHDFRHNFATALIQNRESMPYIRDQLGHSSIQIKVDTYGHLMPSRNRKAVDALDDLNWRRVGSRGGRHQGQRHRHGLGTT